MSRSIRAYIHAFVYNVIVALFAIFSILHHRSHGCCTVVLGHGAASLRCRALAAYGTIPATMATQGVERRTPTDEMLKRVGLTRERFERMLTQRAEREARAPKVGDPAPDFELPILGARETTVRLADLRREQPVALIFGSYT